MVKFRAIQRHMDKYPVIAMCKHLDVSRSGFYAFLKASGKPDRDAELGACIADCQHRCGKTYGYRRVKIWLEREKGLTLNRKTVYRLMQKYNMLSVIRRKRKYQTLNQQVYKYPNLLMRQFKAERPNQKWVTDISYIGTAQGTLYLSMIRDLYDLSIVSYKTGTEQTIHLVTKTVSEAIISQNAQGKVQLHSDRGFQYTSEPYFRLTQSYGLEVSMSYRGNCYDNAMAENFFSILKAECLNRHKLQTFQEARELIDNYIWFYNHERIQSKTKLTPLEMRSQFC